MVIPTSTSPQLLINRNRLRKSLIVQNVDGAITLYVKRERGPSFAVTSTNFDFQLGPGSSLGLNSLLDGSEAIQDAYSVVAASGTPNINVFETEDITR